MNWRGALIVALLLAAGWQLGHAGWVQGKGWLGQQLMERAWGKSLKQGTSVTPWPGAVSHPVARLYMPRLGLDRLVLEGLDTPVMAWGPGMHSGTGGHKVLAAHRDTHFRFLRQVEPGDRFELQEVDGQRSWWQVESTHVVDARQLRLDLDWPEEIMTLVTCYPFNAVQAGGPGRFVVRLVRLAEAGEVSA